MQLYHSGNSSPRLALALARHLRAPLEFIRAAPFAPDQIEFFRTLNPNTADYPEVARAAGLSETYDELKARGVQFRSEPEARFYGIEAMFQDGSGN